MNVTAAMVKELREMTGAGMMDCKKALTKTEGDMDKAVEFLRENGLAKAAKKAGRIAAEGIVSTYVSEDGKTASIVEVNSETDFVAKNEVFRSYVAEVAAQAATTKAANMEEFLDEEWAAEPGMSVKDKLAGMIAKIGENMNIRRFEQLNTEGLIVSYIHAGGKIGVLVEAECDKCNDAIKEALKNVAMQIAAMNPQYINRADISAETLAKEKEITIDSSLADPASLPKPILASIISEAIDSKAWSDEDVAIYEEKKSNMNFLFNFLTKEGIQTLRNIAASHKGEYVVNKIFTGLVEGRFNKQLKEICLDDQIYVKAENKETVAKYVESVAKAEGCTLKIAKFVRYETGEGLEKKNEDFAAEVAAQMGK